MNPALFESYVSQDVSIDNNFLSQLWSSLLKQHGHLIFLLDSTLDETIFTEMLGQLKQHHIAYIPLAINKNRVSSPLLFIEIKEEKVLTQIQDQLITLFLKNQLIDNNLYFVHGFGIRSSDSVELLAQAMQKTLVIEEHNKPILFRWYDPRVLIYLPEIFKKEQLLSLFRSLSQWCFLHPTGYFHFQQPFEKQKNFPLKSISTNQSINLDLIEIANAVYQQLPAFEHVEIYQINPIDIFHNLQHAYYAHGLENYLDLVSYGLYSQIIHANFMQHPIVINTLYTCCVEQNGTFTDAMDLIATDLYPHMQKELNG